MVRAGAKLQNQCRIFFLTFPDSEQFFPDFSSFFLTKNVFLGFPEFFLTVATLLDEFFFVINDGTSQTGHIKENEAL